MVAVVTLHPGKRGRHYRIATDDDYVAVHRAQEQVAKILTEWELAGKRDPCPMPDEPLPPTGTLGFRVQRYGMLKYGDLFTSRQLLSLVTIAAIIRDRIQAASVPNELAALLAMVCSKLADRCNSLVNWSLGVECPNQLFNQIVDSTEQTRLPVEPDYLTRCHALYGEPWRDSHERLVQAARAKTSILDFYEIGRGKPNRPTEILFVRQARRSPQNGPPESSSSPW